MMKKLLMLFVMILMAMTVMAQRTQKITYQAVVRDGANRLVVYTPVVVDVTITYSSGSYFESLRDTTNANGLMSVEIGGNPGFESIDWTEAVIKTVVTIDGGETVTDEVTVTAVPLALYANYAADINPSAPTITAIYSHLGDTLGHYPTSEVLRDSADAIRNALIDTAAAIRADMAAAQVNSDWNATSGVEEILNKPDLSVYATNAHLNDTLGHYPTTDVLKDSATTIRNSIGNGKLTITYGTETPITFTANQKTDTSITIPAPAAPNHGVITIKKNNTDIENGTFNVDQSNDQIINITVPTCDSLADCDLIKDIINRLNSLEHLTDSLARELDKLRPSLTMTASQDTVTVCLGSSQPVTYTATFHNCSSSDYTISWKVNGTDSSNVTTHTLTFNAEAAGEYEVLCVATRSDNTSVTDTVTTTVIVDSAIPSFTASVSNLTVNLSDILNTVTIQWDTDSLPVAFSGTSATHTYSVADTITITATNEGGCTFTKGLRLQATAPTVTTDSVPTSTITATMAIAYGTVTSDGGIPETKRGMVYATSNLNLKLGANGVDSVMNGTGMGSFACNLKRLVPCTQYYVRAFAINEVDTTYGEVKEFTTPSFTCGSTLTDIDGNEYATLQLGSQCWMKQNLRTTHFADGTEIPESTTSSDSPRRYKSGSWSSEDLNAYGYLYNWAAATNGSASSSANPSGVQGACPDGWHLPSDAEWSQLTSFVASDPNNVCGDNPTNIIQSLVSEERWCESGSSNGCRICTDVNTHNTTGFSVLPSGTMNNGGGIAASLGYHIGTAMFRTATEYEASNALVRLFDPDYSYVESPATDKMDGLSIRCVLTCPTDAAYLPTVSTVTLSSTAATISMTANVISDGGATVTERGVCWSTSQNPTTSSDHTADSGTGIGEFTVTGSLTPSTTYYVRAYATNSEGTAYGAEVTFVMPNLPTVTTSAVSNIAATTATAGGNVADDTGGATVSARGVCWSTSQNPTVSDSHTTDGSGTGSFTSNITGLNALTTYYVRAYATNDAGTTYGSQVSFTTTEATPMVTTNAVSDITLDNTTINVTCGGNVTDMGATDVTARGVCWSTSENPTISNSHTTDGSGLGSFTSSITGLTSGETYYVRAYATNSSGTAYGNQVSLTLPMVDAKSCPSAPVVTDHEGNVYATVQIGTQCWMRENLRTTTSPKTGTYLVNTANRPTSPASASASYGSKVAHWYSNNPTTYGSYGLLYNWCAAMDTANSTNYMEVPTPSNVNGNNDYFSVTLSGNHRGICPAGWHLPSYSEWNTLKTAASNTQNNLLVDGSAWSTSATNSTGFTALPAGIFQGSTGTFQAQDKTAFWSCTNGTDRAQQLYMTSGQIKLSLDDKNRGNSVRCIKD